MDKSFWIDSWEKNQTRFHQASANEQLVAHINQLALAPGDTVFVPLCGKSLDMLWLAEQGFDNLLTFSRRNLVCIGLQDLIYLPH